MTIFTKIKNSKLYEKFNSQEFKLFRQIIIYVFFGGFGAIVDISIFKILTSTLLHSNILIANVISASCGIVVSFILNTFFNFKAKTKRMKRFVIFFSIGLSGIVLGTFVLWIFTHFIKDPLISKIMSALIVAAYQFVLNKLITYRDK